MKRSISNIILATAGLFLGILAGQASAGIVGSQHDLSSSGNAQGTGSQDQVCVYCHTPHGSDTNAPVPLWNKVLGAPGSYTQYSTLQTPTFDSQEAPVGSVSLACLSCHDGTQAMDVVINTPGSGGYNPAGAQIDVPPRGVMTGTPIPVLGVDLTDDHPVSMQYAAGGAVAGDPDGTFGGVLGDPDFNPPEKATVNTNAIWWVDSAPGVAGTREKTDMILYARTEFAGVTEPFVECGSCHDPHNAETQGVGQVAFLRVVNSSSQICTACHIK